MITDIMSKHNYLLFLAAPSVSLLLIHMKIDVLKLLKHAEILAFILNCRVLSVFSKSIQ